MVDFNSIEALEKYHKELKAMRNKTKVNDMLIETAYVGATVDKEFYHNTKEHKLTLYFQGLRIHIRVNDDDYRRFKNSITHIGR